jgi:hypothetical protein
MMRTPRTAVKAELHSARRRAGVLVILAAALWWHTLIPGLVFVGFIGWAMLHRRYQGPRREGFMRVRQRVWPPAPLVLAALIVAGTMLYGMSSVPIEVKVLPITLNVLAAGLLVTAAWTRLPRSSAAELPGPA